MVFVLFCSERVYPLSFCLLHGELLYIGIVRIGDGGIRGGGVESNGLREWYVESAV